MTSARKLEVGWLVLALLPLACTHGAPAPAAPLPSSAPTFRLTLFEFEGRYLWDWERPRDYEAAMEALEPVARAGALVELSEETVDSFEFDGRVLALRFNQTGRDRLVAGGAPDPEDGNAYSAWFRFKAFLLEVDGHKVWAGECLGIMSPAVLGIPTLRGDRRRDLPVLSIYSGGDKAHGQEDRARLRRLELRDRLLRLGLREESR